MCIYVKPAGGAWRLIAAPVTDGEGRFRVYRVNPLPLGTHELWAQVPGDASRVSAKVYVRPLGTILSVFDLDGTLTKSDRDSLLKQVGDRPPEVKPHAQELTQTQNGHCYVNLYLTARPSTWFDSTRRWLSEKKFAPGALHMTTSNNPAEL